MVKTKFSGYYLATAADDSCVKLWDLRKLKNFRTLQLDDGYEVKDLSFDSSGTYLAVAGSDVRVYLCKQWDVLKVKQLKKSFSEISIDLIVSVSERAHGPGHRGEVRGESQLRGQHQHGQNPQDIRRVNREAVNVICVL